MTLIQVMIITRWWQLKHFLIFTPKLGEDEPILTHIFLRGWFNHQPVIRWCSVITSYEPLSPPQKKGGPRVEAKPVFLVDNPSCPF